MAAPVRHEDETKASEMKTDDTYHGPTETVSVCAVAADGQICPAWAPAGAARLREARDTNAAAAVAAATDEQRLFHNLAKDYPLHDDSSL